MYSRRRRLPANTDAKSLALGPPLRCGEQVDSDEEEDLQTNKLPGRGEPRNASNNRVRALDTVTSEQRPVSCLVPLKGDIQEDKENSIPFRPAKNQGLENDLSQLKVSCQGSKPLLYSKTQENVVPTPGSPSNAKSANSANFAKRGASCLSAEVQRTPLTCKLGSVTHFKPTVPNTQVPIKREAQISEQTFPKAARAPSTASSFKLVNPAEEAAQTYPDSFHQSQVEEQRACSSQLHRTPTTHPVGAHDSLHKASASANKHLATNLLLHESVDGGSQQRGGTSVRMLNLPQQFVIIQNSNQSEPDKIYQKLAVIGMGASSKVFKVLGEDGNIYAVKEVYIKHTPSEIKTAYVNEVKLLRKLQDKPGIITLHDYHWDRQQGVLNLVLEYGETDLAGFLSSRGPSNPLRNDPALLLYLWNQMLNIVKVIHQEGIIHNDLKPGNFVCSGLKLKLIDFGIANRIMSEHTSVEKEVRCGTVNYMAPEAIVTHEENDYYKVGRPADVWSLGCILYQMIYQRTPFEHMKTKIQKWKAITDPNCSIVFPGKCSKEASDVLQACLRRNPKERPSVDELLMHPFSTMCIV